MSDTNERIYHKFERANGMLLRELLPYIRHTGYSNYDELGEIVICVEAEEWTWARFNLSSCLLDMMGDLIVESISANDEAIEVWIHTDDFNWIKGGTA